MKLALLVLSLLFIVSCSGNIEKATIYDCGKKEIGKGVYLKKIKIHGDRIYMLVDENDKLINGNTASSYTISDDDNNSHTESNTLINQ
jgi:hypothetical protein